MQFSISNLTNWLESNFLSLVASVLVLLIYLVAMSLARPRLDRGVEKSNLQSKSLTQARISLRTIGITFTVAVLLLIWGIDLQGLMLLGTGILTVTGVALFASWSLISNITAFLVLIMHKSFNRGSFVRILDADNYAEGYISEISLFSTRLVTEQREVINYPNNLILSRPIVINPRKRYNGIGKFSEFIDKKCDDELSKSA